ncbi:Fe2+-enterobactin ABC transporter substrate-binding protein [Nonomuraea monospora]|uniref:Fe2+-enterobactin ABC transporter substrate-binding protein n=1 Tax=Nonomuraea monospora TaxID=568818 RepID=A0ABN3C9R2_9ACTN
MASLIRAGLAALLAAVSLAACGSGDDPAAGTSAQAGPARTVQHEAGTTEVPATPKRIVSTSVTMTGHLLALGAPVVSSQATPPGPITDANGFFKQWSDAATKAGVTVLYQGYEADIEKVIAAKPDLIVGSASGADSTAKVYDQLKAVAPTILFRHDNVTWQELSTKLGQALGLEANAAKLVADYDQRVTEVKNKIKLPAEDAVVLRDNNTDIPVFTEASAQGGLLTALGFKLHPVDAALAAESSKEGGGRKDIVNISQENVIKAFGDSSIFFAGHSPQQIAATEAKALWKDLPAVTGKRVYDLGLDSFRIDYYSATNILGRIEQQFS